MNGFQPRPEILLHPNIPKPLHGMSPRVIFGQEWWDKHRRIAYAKTGYRCAACGVPKSNAKFHQWLEAHELYEINYKKGTMTFVELVALCHCCHNYIHSGRLAALFESGEITPEKFEIIHRHGEAVLKRAGLLEKRRAVEQAMECGDEGVDWEDWRLVIDGQAYKGKFQTYADWADHYGYDVTMAEASDVWGWDNYGRG